MKNIYIIITLLCFTGMHAASQSISRHIVSAGGGRFQNGDIILSYTIGEPFIDFKSNGDTVIEAGFWPTVNATSPPDVVLASRFIQFSALLQNNNALLNWQVVNETDATGHYEVERSFNAINFKKVGAVQPRVNTGLINYSYTDLNLSSVQASGIFYYRIKQVDKDGYVSYSATKMIRVNSKAIVLSLYPNPVKNMASLSIDVAQKTSACIVVYDLNGRQVKFMQAQLSEGQNILNMDMSRLAAGHYLLKVQTATENKTVPIIKIN
ncbi:MAG TPA: T9SS type A sorting domain-containing protein [Parafilimonas sp.]|nr:T9SS type A sorting domain-containing protein [Parafilimonas sp.]